MSMKINKLEIENVKRVKAVKIEPTANGLTIIGGKNNQGKTSVLDAIAWALGGCRYRPSQAQREGSVIPPNLHIVMNNGLIVERRGKNSDLKVTDPNGKKAGQQLLNEFVEQLALDLPKFMEATSREKAQTLLQIIGVDPRLADLERQEKELYNESNLYRAYGRPEREVRKGAALLSGCPVRPCIRFRTDPPAAGDPGTERGEPEKEGAAPPAGAGIPVRHGTDPDAPCKAGAAGGRP